MFWSIFSIRVGKQLIGNLLHHPDDKTSLKIDLSAYAMWIEKSWSIINSKDSSWQCTIERACKILFEGSSGKAICTNLLLVRVLVFSDAFMYRNASISCRVVNNDTYRYTIYSNYHAYVFASTEYSSRAKSSRFISSSDTQKEHCLLSFTFSRYFREEIGRG